MKNTKMSKQIGDIFLEIESDRDYYRRHRLGDVDCEWAFKIKADGKVVYGEVLKGEEVWKPKC